MLHHNGCARRHDGDDAAHACQQLQSLLRAASGRADEISSSPRELGRGHRPKPTSPSANALDAVSG